VSSGPSTRLRAAPAALAAASLAAAGTVGYVNAAVRGGEQVPRSGGPEAGFARDMQVNHAQSVEMSTLLRDRADVLEIRSLALDVAIGQQQQIGQMFAWLETWGPSGTDEGQPQQSELEQLTILLAERT
jgi:uncharacterized protein (DUF305 family)